MVHLAVVWFDIVTW